MNPLSFSQLLVLATQIAQETIEGANTADRVGSFLLALVRSATMPYDGTSELKNGQYTLFGDGLYRVLSNTSVGESPSNTPEKFRLLSPNLQAILSTTTSAQRAQVGLSLLQSLDANGQDLLGEIIDSIRPVPTTPTLGDIVDAADGDNTEYALAQLLQNGGTELVWQLIAAGLTAIGFGGDPEVTIPTLDQVIDASTAGGSDKPVRLGATLQRNPPLVQTIQRFVVDFFTGDTDLYARANITWSDFLSYLIASRALNLDAILYGGNVSEGTGVMGGLALFGRPIVDDSQFDSVPVGVPATIAGKGAHYFERTNRPGLRNWLFSAMTAEERTQMVAWLFPNQDGDSAFYGRVVELRCIDIPDNVVQVGTVRYVPLVNVADGGIITTPVAESDFLYEIYSAKGRAYSPAWIEPLDPPQPYKVKFNNPGATAPFSGTLKIEPKPTSVTP